MLEGMQAGVGAVIASVSYQMGSDIIGKKSALSVFIMLIAFLINFYFKVNVIYIILICILVGVIQTLLSKGMEKSK